MTLTIDRKIYGALLAEFQPQVITTVEQNEQALAFVEKLSEVVRGKRAISKNQAKALADFFHVSPSLFL